MDLPDRINPGPLAARITWFAPVSLLFFLAVMVILGVLRGHSLHPMNYAFVSAAFFAFHLLLAYLVDHLDLHLSFAIAAITSVALVVSYLRVVVGNAVCLSRSGPRAAGLSGVLQLRVLLRGLYRADRHGGSNHHAVRADAAHGQGRLGRRVRPARNRLT